MLAQQGKTKVNKNEAPSFSTRVLRAIGWGAPVPAAPLLLCLHVACGRVLGADPLHKAEASVEVWIVWVLSVLFFISNHGLHWYVSQHYPSHLNTWRSLLRSLCALSLSFSMLLRVSEQIFAHLFPSFYPGILVPLVSGITCALNQIWSQNSWGNLILGCWNWASLILFVWVHATFTDTSSMQASNFASVDARLFLLVCGVDLLSAPYQRHDTRELHLWSFIWTILFPVIYTIMEQRLHWSFQSVISSGNAVAWLLLFVPCVLYSQRCYFWNWTLPAIRSQHSKYKATSVHIVFVVAIVVVFSLHATFYAEIERILLISHFVLHWLAHLTNVYAISIPLPSKK